MLPSVDTHQRHVVTGYGILVGSGDNLESSGCLVLDEPGPPAALDAGQSRVDLALQGREGPEVAVDGGLREPS